jgi:hypothetical protein
MPVAESHGRQQSCFEKYDLFVNHWERRIGGVASNTLALNKTSKDRESLERSRPSAAVRIE